LLCITVWLTACGSSGRYAERSYAPEPQAGTGGAMADDGDFPRPVSAGPPRPSPARAQGYASREVQTSKSKSYAGSDRTYQSQPQQQAQTKTGSQQTGEIKGGKTQPAEALVVYMGYLKLRVRRVLEALDAITKATEKAGGYVESMSANVVIVRVPGADFERALAGFAEYGEVLDRRVKALDVTSAFTDLSGRLQVARESRTRLLKLLAEVKEPEERLRILQEVKRLSEQIESLESTLATLRNLVDYFTITIELVPVVAETRTEARRSPFEWVRELKAHIESIEDGRKKVDLTVPPSFVVFDKARSYRAQAADTTTIRAGFVDNEPLGDNAFWAGAVAYEMDARDEESVAMGTAGATQWHVWRNKDVRPRYYLVGVMALDKKLWVIEVFYPTEDAFKRHETAVLKALEGFKVK